MFVLCKYQRVMFIIVVIIFLLGNNIGAAYSNATDRNKGYSTPRATIACVAACQGAPIAPPEKIEWYRRLGHETKPL